MTHITRAELFLRESVAAGARTEQARVQGRLQSLSAAGVIAALSVRRWPHRVTVGDADARREFALYREFEAWADAHGVRLAPAFERHDCHNSFTDSHYTTVVLPVTCLALYDDEDLIAVYPHSSEAGIRTVLDGVSMLEAESGLATERTRPWNQPRAANQAPPNR
ncbi:hypothetical protein BV210_17415 [Halorientalis sp. IM1011]|uniref:HTH domain-containing protein n=1 Tax=Halorientalis sp. IM1011 TaxID=1932360 RepID=UPI00097CCF09|nr:HTH domain-containing protein [Halorientalis sp. IM1011]AQL44385.1 hypothetical protein BV210_17415 [Halorientalis sp. IM1011]